MLSPEYRNLSPEQIVARLADLEKRFVCSAASFRRVLKEHRLDTHRQRSRPPTKQTAPASLEADGPGQAICWDITYLKFSRLRGGYFFLYLFIDAFSRKVVCCAVHDEQSSELAAREFRALCETEGLTAGAAVLHSDNGAPMKGSTMLATLHQLGVAASFSRPGVSNDNAIPEAFFRHLKYVPKYPTDGFVSLKAAREWVEWLIRRYNEEHLHSGISYVTPSDRYTGRDIALLANRREVYEAARHRNPRRWSRHTRAWKWAPTQLVNSGRPIRSPSKPRGEAACPKKRQLS
ncbi:MAG: transposase InsO family protein [Bradymonadia bacterium]|jgi:transposase InsO family protein